MKKNSLKFDDFFQGKNDFFYISHFEEISHTKKNVGIKF